MNLRDLLQLTIERKASDLHLVSGTPPTLRIDGALVPIADEAILNGESIESLLRDFLSQAQIAKLTKDMEIDFSLAFSDVARFRVNVYTQKKTWAAAFRTIPLSVPPIETLGLPDVVHRFTELKQGLILVTGPTGHGKSTSLAAMIDQINKTRKNHIVTIEDPIEFVFTPQKSIISQREMFSDTKSWKAALKSALREDPDVVLVGEMRDYETIASVLTLAETGHLVFATLHTNSAAQTIDRVVDVFPREQQDQVKLQLSNVLEAVISQRLLPGISGGRVLASEVLLATHAIKTTIREGKTHQIDSIIQTSSDVGMMTLETSLASMVSEGRVTLETASAYALRPDQLKRLVRGVV